MSTYIDGATVHLDDIDGNHDMLDLAPAAGGKKGQIVSVWHDEETRTLEGDSFLDWLEEQTWSA